MPFICYTIISGKSARGNVKRSMGPIKYSNGGNRRPHLQRYGFHRNYADDMEKVERPWEKLASRLQGVSSNGISHKDR